LLKDGAKGNEKREGDLQAAKGKNKELYEIGGKKRGTGERPATTRALRIKRESSSEGGGKRRASDQERTIRARNRDHLTEKRTRGETPLSRRSKLDRG